jgi:fatty-acyl-CoA synthase
MHDHPIRSLADIKALERVPLDTRLEGLTSTVDAIRRTAERRPDAPALAFVPDGEATAAPVELTYAQLLGNVTRSANAFAALGLGPRDVVSYALPNLLETHYTIWGGEAAGIVNAVNPLLEPDHVAHILNAVGSKLLVTLGPARSAPLWQKLDAVRRQVPTLRAVLVVGEDGDIAPDVMSFERAIAAQPAERLVPARRIDRGDIASCFHTGGTTGVPRVARHTHLNELADAWGVATMGGMGPGDTLLCGLPLFHVNGVIVTGLAPFMAGARVVLLGADGYRSPGTIRGFWRNVERFRASFFSGVPTIYSMLLGVPVDADVSSLRYALCGAAPMPPELIRRFEAATGVKILEGYGLTEGTCVSAINPRDGERLAGSIGLRLPYQSMKAVVVDAEGRYARDCATDEIGRLVIKGPNVFPGYKDEKANRGIWVDDGWLDTGDLARQDAAGRFWLTGRQKDLIIRGGHNIDPAMIEEALLKHPSVQMAAAVGKPDAHAGELPLAYVVLKPGASATAGELLAHARATVPERGAVPSEIVVRESLPVTAVGKIFKPELRFDAARRTLQAALDRVAPGVVECRVSVGPDERHGTIVRVTLRPLGRGARNAEPRLRQALAAFSLGYELEWE